MIFYIIIILSYVIEMNSNISKLATISQFFFIFKDIFANNSKTAIATDIGLVSFKR